MCVGYAKLVQCSRNSIPFVYRYGIMRTPPGNHTFPAVGVLMCLVMPLYSLFSTCFISLASHLMYVLLMAFSIDESACVLAVCFCFKSENCDIVDYLKMRSHKHTINHTHMYTYIQDVSYYKCQSVNTFFTHTHTRKNLQEKPTSLTTQCQKRPNNLWSLQTHIVQLPSSPKTR